MQDYNSILSPFRFGNVEVKNRIELAPACHCLASPDGFATKEMIAYYQSIARGGAGIITIGETPVDYHFARRHDYQINISDERVLAGLYTLVEAVHRYGAKLSIELCHAGGSQLGHPEGISPSPGVCKLEEVLAKVEGRKKTRNTVMTQDMIDDVIDSFATAAERCLRAGFEMIMLHGGHGHLLAQFTSPYLNKRTDEYGGSLENRAKFVIELLDAIRRRVGDKLAIEYRISASEGVAGGMQEEETIAFVKMIQDKIDLLHVSSGILNNPETAQHLILPTYLPHCHNLHYAERLKKELSVPIVTVGSISDMRTADNIIKEGKADMVAMARALMADPEIVNKTRRGDNSEVRPCLRCNVCSNLTSNCFPIRCTVNPVLGRETDYANIAPAKKAKKVVIAGGGPAGMQAALTSSCRGHEVILHEKSAGLGGHLINAAGPAFKDDMKLYLDWLIRQVQKDPNVSIKLNSEATADSIKAENPDVVFIAIGAEPILPDSLFMGKDNVVWAGDVHTDKASTGETVVVAGGGLTGFEAALHLAQDGKKVTIIDMLDMRALTADIPGLLMTLLREKGVRIMSDVMLEEITDAGVSLIDKTWKRIDLPADTVVLSLGFAPSAGVIDSFRDIVPDVYFIGDCKKPKDLYQAIHGAFDFAVEI